MKLSIPEGLLLMCLYRDGCAILATYASAAKDKRAADAFDRSAKIVQQFLVQVSGEVVPPDAPTEGVGAVTREQADIAMDAAMMQAPLTTFAEKMGLKTAGKYGKRIVAEAILRSVTLYGRAVARGGVAKLQREILEKAAAQYGAKVSGRAMRAAAPGFKWAAGTGLAEKLGIVELTKKTLRWGLFFGAGYYVIGPLTKKLNEALRNLLSGGIGLVAAGLVILWFLSRRQAAA